MFANFVLLPMVLPTISGELRDILKNIPDPEIPVLSILDLGVIRKAEKQDEKSVRITLTPTYSGCPAMGVIESDIRQAREKLRAYGIAPPQGKSCGSGKAGGQIIQIPCPRCGSSNTRMISLFGSTACKALYACEECKEPFDYFKCL
jgi:ring-1,2-phenylacetyl-CoA epoxidase subunit PaaD